MKKKIHDFKELISTNELRILPGSLAYSFFLALVPIISLIFYITTSFNLPNDIILNFINKTFPEGVATLLQPVFSTTMTIKSLIPVVMGIGVAMNGCGAIIIASNTVHNIENAPLIKRLVKSLVLVIIITILFTFIFLVPLFGQSIINLISTFTSFISDNEKIINRLYFILQVPISMIIMFYTIKLIYIIAPDAKIPHKSVNKGTIFTTVSWLIVTIIFSYYINHIARYDKLYGNLANIVILLFWFYILAYIFVIGLSLNKKNSDESIEKTNTIKLEEIRNKIKENK